MNLAKKHFIIITGLSGAGKTQASKVFEDMGYFCVDNLPAPLILSFADFLLHSQSAIEKVCLVMDLRDESFLSHLSDSLGALIKAGISYEILFLEASNEVLVQRFKENRRQHPQNVSGNLLEGILLERHKLKILRGLANIVIDTSRKQVSDLRETIIETWKNGKDDFSITITSFGFKHGLPIDNDIIMDVRFLKNPYYEASLRELTGRDIRVREYIFSYDASIKFLNDYTDLLLSVLPQYRQEGKRHVSIGIGCTGGKHRSIATVILLADNLTKQGYYVNVVHRDN